MKELSADMDCTRRRDTQCGTCQWYNGIFDCCGYPGRTRREAVAAPAVIGRPEEMPGPTAGVSNAVIKYPGANGASPRG